MTAPAGGADRIELRGLQVRAVHGVLPEERERVQPFEIDVDMELDLTAAGRSDDLADTVDYGAVTDAVVRVMAGPPVNLMERLADQIASAVRDAAGPHLVSAVTVSVRKLEPPVPHALATAGVTIRRPAAGE